MALIISDANTLIDFEHARLTPRLFQLELELAVPDLLYHDELSKHHGDLPSLGLQLLELSPALISQAYEYRRQHPKPSIYDLFALVLSLNRQSPLLTGDKALRDLARSKGVPVFGTIWLMEQLFDARLVTIDEMESAYGIMLDNQSRLPEREIGRQLRRLKAKS